MSREKKDWKKKRRFRQAFARILQKLFNRPLLSPPYTGPLSTIAILAQERYGDAILLTPLLKTFKKEFPETAVHLVTFSKAVTTFFKSDPNITTIHYAKGNQITYFNGILSQKFDVLFNTKDHPSTNFLLQSLIIRARCKMGVHDEFHTGLFDFFVDADFHTHIAQKNCALLKLLGKEIPALSCRPYIPPMPVSEKIRSFTATLKPQAVSGINLSAGGKNRYWTEKKWSEIISSHPTYLFLIVSTPRDLDKKKRLEQHHHNVIPSPSTKNLLEAGMIVERLKVLLTPDTAMVHVASCYNVPVIGLYGQAFQDQTRFGPFLIQNKMVISPTAQVQDIAVTSVANALREFLENTTS
ncbi:MAG: glycosyltransferase family 9 protein [Chlorobiales bacterium]|nr:glycosyltransferase family 9 protein [Chlorobiales bacterium]